METKALSCAVCLDAAVTDDNKIITCSRCSLSVHQGCFGIPSTVNPKKWDCHKCQNDDDPDTPKARTAPPFPPFHPALISLPLVHRTTIASFAHKRGSYQR